MIAIRYERHLLTNSHLPFIFHTDIVSETRGIYSNWHDNTEILCCISGSGVVHSDNEVLPMHQGDTIVINQRCLHYITSETKVMYYCLIIDNSFFAENGFDIPRIRFISRFCDSKASLLMEKVCSCFKSEPSTFRIAEIRLAVLNYILYLCKSYLKQDVHASVGNISKGHEAVLKAVEYIDRNYEKHLTIDEIASVAGFSKFHFSRLFKNYTGFTVVEHINGRRCENARIMLENDTKSISQIASDCGFDSCSYFSKAFFRIFGILPSEYRKSLK